MVKTALDKSDYQQLSIFHSETSSFGEGTNDPSVQLHSCTAVVLQFRKKKKKKNKRKKKTE